MRRWGTRISGRGLWSAGFPAMSDRDPQEARTIPRRGCALFHEDRPGCGQIGPGWDGENVPDVPGIPRSLRGKGRARDQRSGIRDQGSRIKDRRRFWLSPSPQSRIPTPEFPSGRLGDAIDRPAAGAGQHQRQRYRNGEQAELDARKLISKRTRGARILGARRVRPAPGQVRRVQRAGVAAAGATAEVSDSGFLRTPLFRNSSRDLMPMSLPR